MKKIKEVKGNSLVFPILSLLYGLVLTIWPEIQADILCYVIAGAIILCGFVFLIQYIRKDVVKDFYKNELVFGLFAIILGIVALIRVDAVQNIIPTVIGIVVLFSGVVKVQNAFDLLRLKQSNWLAVFIISIINIAFALFLIFKPQSSIALVFRLLGIGLVFSGITDLITNFFFSAEVRKMNDDNIID
ncbi:MAG: HdeD family acid-resistance protein [Lachnospiraceae bacterium]